MFIWRTHHRWLYVCLVSAMVGLGSQANGQNYYPDEFGNTWVLRSTDGIDERTVTIEGPENINGEPLKVIKDQTNENITRLFVKIEPDGVKLFRTETAVFLLGDVTFNYSPPETFVPNPVALGTEWTVTSRANLPIVGELAAINTQRVTAIEDVVVPAGTFRDALKVETSIVLALPIGDILQDSTMWLAPDVGLVKSIDTNGVIFELVSFKVMTIDDPPIAVQPQDKLSTIWAKLKTQ